MESELPPENVEKPVDNRPLLDRLVDKNWKCRIDAFEELRKELADKAEDQSALVDYVHLLPNLTSDGNAGALDAGLDVALAMTDMSTGSLTSRITHLSEQLTKNVVDKTTSARASTAAKGKALVLKLMEVDEPTACTTALLAKLSDKKPKVPPACLEMIKEGIVLFGVKAFPVKEIVKSLGAVMNGSNGAAREVCMALMVEIGRWIGQTPLQALLESLRSAQKTDFERAFASMQADQIGKPRPTLWLRKERPVEGAEGSTIGTGGEGDKLGSSAAGAGCAAGAGAAAPTAEDEGVDPREFVEEVDLTKKLKGSEYSSLVEDEKWSNQLKGLQLVMDAIGPVPKIKAGCDVEDVVGACKGFLRQGHVQLQVSSLKILGMLADGLRTEFGGVVRPLTQSIVQKCKEKRLVPEVQPCLGLILKHCLALDSFVEDISEQLRNKKVPPHGKVCLMEFIASAVQDGQEKKINSDSLKALVDCLLGLCEDSDPKVRDQCTVSLGTLAPLVKKRGKPTVDTYKALMALEKSAPRVYKKMAAAMEAAAGGGAGVNTVGTEPEIGSKPKASAAAPQRPNTARSNDAEGDEQQSTKQVSKSLTSLPGKKTGAAKGGAKKGTGGSGGAGKERENDDEVEDLSMSAEEAVEVLGGLSVDGWESSIQTLMRSAKWQDKVEALAAIEKKLIEKKAGGEFSAALVTYLSSSTNNFKITNVSVQKAVLQTATSAAANCGAGRFHRPAAWELLRAFGDKLSDKKVSEVLQGLLTAISECVSPSFVVKRMKSVMEKTKAPLAHQHYLEWLKGSIQEFGSGAFPVQYVCSFCQQELDNKVATVRTGAVEVLGALYHQLGPKLLSLCVSDDTKPQVRALMEAEFARVGHDPSAGAKAIRAVQQGDAAEEGGAGSSAGGIPRQDLSSLLDKNFMSELNHIEGKTSWQNRKAAMEMVIAACERSGHYLEANKATFEIVKATRARVNDTQANLKPIAVTTIGHVLASLELEACAKILKVVGPALMGGLNDNKKAMRDATVTAIQLATTLNKQPTDTALADPQLLSVLVPSIVESLANPVGRQELLAWMVQSVDSFRQDCTELTAPLVLTMQDKTAAVRSLSEQLLFTLMGKAFVTRTHLDRATRDLSPASKRALQSAIDRLNAAFGSLRQVNNGAADSKSAPSSSSSATAPTAGSVGGTAKVPLSARSTDLCSNSSSEGEGEAPSGRSAADGGSKLNRGAAVGASPAAGTSKPDLSQSSAEPISADGGWLLKRTNKTRRLEDFFRLNWPQPPAEPAESDYAALRAGWEHLVTSDLAYLLFPTVKFGSTSQEAFLPAVSELATQLDCPHFLQHMDLLLRWVCCVLFMRESPAALLKILHLLCDVFETVRSSENAALTSLHETEILTLMPHLVDRCGHNSERHRASFRQVLEAASEVIAPARYNQLMVQGLYSKNRKSRVVCLEELRRVVEVSGAPSLGRAGVKEVGGFLESKDIDVNSRNACLELLYALYISLGCDAEKLLRLLGDQMSQRSLSMIDDRIRQKNRSRSTMGTGAGAGVATNGGGSMSKSPASHRKSGSADSEDALRGSAVSSPAGLKSEGEVEGDFSSRAYLDEIDAVIASSPMPLNALSAMSSPGSGSEATDGAFLYETDPSLSFSKSTSMGNSSQRTKLATEIGIAGFDDFPPSPVQVPPNLSDINNAEVGEMESILIDVSARVEFYLAQPASSYAAAGRTSSTLQRAYEDAKDYIKMLHSIVSGEWSSECAQPEDDAVIVSRSQGLVLQLLQCIHRAFSAPTTADIPRGFTEAGGTMEGVSGGSPLGVDVSLLAICISTLFAMVQRRDVAERLTEATLFDVYHTSLLYLVDARLLGASELSSAHADKEADAEADPEVQETAQQILRAFNMVLLKLSMEAETSAVLRVLLRVLFLCIPTAEAHHAKHAKPLPAACTKPASRLIVKVLTDESNSKHVPGSAPFASPSFNMKELLQGIHEFFSKHPANTVDDTPFRTAKTMLNEVIKALGGYQVITILQETNISQTAFIYVLTSRLGNVQVTDTNTEMHARLVACIDEITSSRDKVAAIRELHKIKKANPSLDINLYLHKISSAFRRFVLDTLAKLDAAEGAEGSKKAVSATAAGGTGSVSSSSSASSRTMSGRTSDENQALNYRDAERGFPPAKRLEGAAASGRGGSDSDLLGKYKMSSVRTNEATGALSASSADDSRAYVRGEGRRAAGGSGSSSSETSVIDRSTTPDLRNFLGPDNPANEALRIIEGLKIKQSALPPSVRHRHNHSQSLSHSADQQQMSELRDAAAASLKEEEQGGNRDGSQHSAGTTLLSLRSVERSASGRALQQLQQGPLLAPSPFAERNDKIRDSLSSLSASLDLLPNLEKAHGGGVAALASTPGGSRLSLGRTIPLTPSPPTDAPSAGASVSTTTGGTDQR